MLTTHAWVLVHPLYKCRWLGYLYTPVAAAGVGRKNTCLIMRTSSSHVLSAMSRRALLFWCFCTGMLSELHPCCDHCWSLCVVLFHVVFHAGWRTILVHFIEVLLIAPSAMLPVLKIPSTSLVSSHQSIGIVVLLQGEDATCWGPSWFWSLLPLARIPVVECHRTEWLVEAYRWDVVGSHLQLLPNSQECCNSKWSCLTSWACWRCRGTLVPCWVPTTVEWAVLLTQKWLHKKGWIHDCCQQTVLTSSCVTRHVDLHVGKDLVEISHPAKRKSYWLSQWCWYR